MALAIDVSLIILCYYSWGYDWLQSNFKYSLVLEFIVLITSLCAAPMSSLHYISKTSPAVIIAKEPLKGVNSLACLMIIVESLTQPAVVACLGTIVPMLL